MPAQSFHEFIHELGNDMILLSTQFLSDLQYTFPLMSACEHAILRVALNRDAPRQQIEANILCIETWKLNTKWKLNYIRGILLSIWRERYYSETPKVSQSSGKSTKPGKSGKSGASGIYNTSGTYDTSSTPSTSSKSGGKSSKSGTSSESRPLYYVNAALDCIHTDDDDD